MAPSSVVVAFCDTGAVTDAFKVSFTFALVDRVFDAVTLAQSALDAYSYAYRHSNVYKVADAYRHADAKAPSVVLEDSDSVRKAYTLALDVTFAVFDEEEKITSLIFTAYSL